VEKLKARIELSKYDVEAWQSLISELKSRPRTPELLDFIRQIYGDMLEVFPTSCTTWKGYLDLEMSSGGGTEAASSTVSGIFSNCLLKVKSLDVWRVYIKHVKSMNVLDAPEGLSAVKQAYEFTLDHLGTDISSGTLWMEYIHFLQQANAMTLFGQTAMGNEESAKLVAIRRAFQRAVTIPTHSLESLWRDYEKFENGVNRQLGKQILNDLQSQYSASRTIYRGLKKKWEGIKVDMLATPPNPKQKVGGDYGQQTLWTKLIAFERSNPLKLEKDPLSVRVELVYNQCLLCLYHYPEVWYEYAIWHADNDRQSNASTVFKDACAALPTCTILYFAAADFEASQENMKEAKSIYENLLSRASDLDRDTQGQIWIQYMRFLRRIEGPSSSRKLFLRARKSEGCTHHIYSTSALLEWQNGKDMKVAKNIFELGLKVFLKNTEYVLEYASFLISQGDISNARTLYERALTVAQGADAKIIWNEYLKFEYQCGDLQSTLALEVRRKEALLEMDEAETDGGVEEGLKQPRFNIGLLLLRYGMKYIPPCSTSTLQHLERVGVDEATYGLPGMTNFTDLQKVGEGGLTLGSFGGDISSQNNTSKVGMTGKQQQKSGNASSSANLGGSSLPPAIAALLSKLPLRHQLTGALPTRADVDTIMGTLVNMEIPGQKQPNVSSSSSHQQGGRNNRSHNNTENDRKRKNDATGAFTSAPRNDVYLKRMRQKQNK
jgi:cleavage stimulation factor subunit 3